MLTSQDPKDVKYHSKNLQLINLFETEIYNKSKKIDPHDEHEWYSLTLGWALAKGLSVSRAHAFALHIRYNTD